MTTTLTWKPFQQRPFGEMIMNVPTVTHGLVDVTFSRTFDWRWQWFIFGTEYLYLDAEGNQDVITQGTTDTADQARAAIEHALEELK